MTADDLRALARNQRVRATGYEAASRELNGLSGRVDGALVDVSAASQLAWRGPAADSFERDVRYRSDVVDNQAALMRGHARSLANRADEARAEAGRLEAEAAALEAAAATSRGAAPGVE